MNHPSSTPSLAAKAKIETHFYKCCWISASQSIRLSIVYLHLHYQPIHHLQHTCLHSDDSVLTIAWATRKTEAYCDVLVPDVNETASVAHGGGSKGVFGVYRWGKELEWEVYCTYGTELGGYEAGKYALTHRVRLAMLMIVSLATAWTRDISMWWRAALG